MGEELFKIIIDKIKVNNRIIITFGIFGLILAILDFNLNSKSNFSLFVIMATILTTLLGFIGIIVIFKLQNIQEFKSHYIKRVDKLKDKLKVHKLPGLSYDENKIPEYIIEINKNITKLDEQIEKNYSEGLNAIKFVDDRQLYNEINFYLELISDKINEIKVFGTYRECFLFAFFCIFLFTIPIAFSNISISNNSPIYYYVEFFFIHIRFLNLPLTGILFGFYLVSLNDFINILRKFLSE